MKNPFIERTRKRFQELLERYDEGNLSPIEFEDEFVLKLEEAMKIKEVDK